MRLSHSGTNVGSTILASSLVEGLSSIQALRVVASSGSVQSEGATVSSTETSVTLPIHRTFIIGGATIYKQALESLPNLNRILLTRVLEPSFDDCDVFLPEFRPVEEYDSRNGKEVSDAGVVANSTEPPSWVHTSHENLVRWAGFDVAKGINEEKGIKYEFQMWVRGGDPYSDEI